MKDVSARMAAPPYLPDIWPGEHYKLLAGLVLALKPRLVVEIGTATGLSALAMMRYLPPESRLVTFDIIDWQSYPGQHLRSEDFAAGRLVQYVDDLSQSAVAQRYHEVLKGADMIFIDAAKDRVMERKFVTNFRRVPFERKPLLVFDDIRVWNMLRIWQELPFPKLDVTSFGHWSGTGLVEWR